KSAAAYHTAGKAANRERRRRALIDPFARTVDLGQREDLAVDRPYDHGAVRRFGRSAHFTRDFRLPERLAARVEGEHVALVCSDGERSRIGADAGGERLRGV